MDVYSTGPGDLVAHDAIERRSRLMSLAVAAFGAGLFASSIGLVLLAEPSFATEYGGIPVLVAYGGLASQGAGFLIAGALLHRMAGDRARLALEREGILEEISQALERVNDRLERAERSYREHERRREREGGESRIFARLLDHEERLHAVELGRDEPMVRLTPSARKSEIRPREEQAEGS